VDRVAKDLDVYTLQDNIDHITFCNIENEIDNRMIDPNYIKLFKLSQLTIEYLMVNFDF
jgi:zinc finger protein DZIP1